jgi:hypothetical protein
MSTVHPTSLKRKLPYVTVSARGLSNGLSSIPNDGADFGPDTLLGATAPGQYGPPYTQTSGIQEAINYLPQSSSNYSGSGGGRIYLRKGLYKIYSQIVIPANYAEYLVMEGEGMGTTELRWSSGAAPQYGMITQTNLSGKVPMPLNLVVEDLMLSAPASMPMYLMYLTPNIMIAERVAFSSVEMLTQSATGAGYTFDFNYAPTVQPSLQGAYIWGTDGNGYNFEECVFQGLANGIYFYETFHVYVNRSKFAFIGRWSNNGTDTDSVGLTGTYTQYGPAIIWDGGTGTYDEFYITHNHFFNNFTDLLIVNTAFNGNPEIAHNLFDASEYNLIISPNYASLQVKGNLFTIVGTIPNRGIYSINTSTGALSTTVNNVSLVDSTFNIITPSANYFNYPAITTPSMPSSGTAQQNTYLFPVEVVLNGGTVTQITITRGGTTYTVFSNSSGAALSGQVYRLEPGDSITLTYSTAPSWTWLPA